MSMGAAILLSQALDRQRAFAKAWKRAAKKWRDYQIMLANAVLEDIPKLRTENAELRGALDEVIGMTKEEWAGMKNLRSTNQALKAKIEALLCEFENAAAMSSQKRTAEWFLRKAREHFGEGGK